MNLKIDVDKNILIIVETGKFLSLHLNEMRKNCWW